MLMDDVDRNRIVALGLEGSSFAAGGGMLLSDKKVGSS